MNHRFRLFVCDRWARCTLSFSTVMRVCSPTGRGEQGWTSVTSSQRFPFFLPVTVGAVNELLHHWLDPKAVPPFSLDCAAKPSCQPMWRGQAECETFKFIWRKKSERSTPANVDCIDKETIENIPQVSYSKRIPIGDDRRIYAKLVLNIRLGVKISVIFQGLSRQHR